MSIKEEVAASNHPPRVKDNEDTSATHSDGPSSRSPPATWTGDEVRWDGYNCKVLDGNLASVSGFSQKCQVAGCKNSLLLLKNYFRRYRICEYHWKLDSLEVNGIQQRFCQQCGRFEPLIVFDGTRRTCRMRLAKHNQRRRRARAAHRSENLAGRANAGSSPTAAGKHHTNGDTASPHSRDQPPTSASPNSSSASSGPLSLNTSPHPGPCPPPIPKLRSPQAPARNPSPASDPTTHIEPTSGDLERLASTAPKFFGDPRTSRHIPPSSPPLHTAYPAHHLTGRPAPHLLHPAFPHPHQTPYYPYPIPRQPHQPPHLSTASYPNPFSIPATLTTHPTSHTSHPPPHHARGPYPLTSAPLRPPPTLRTPRPTPHPSGEPVLQRRKLSHSPTHPPSKHPSQPQIPQLYTITACRPSNDPTAAPIYETIIAVPLSDSSSQYPHPDTAPYTYYPPPTSSDPLTSYIIPPAPPLTIPSTQPFLIAPPSSDPLPMKPTSPTPSPTPPRASPPAPPTHPTPSSPSHPSCPGSPHSPTTSPSHPLTSPSPSHSSDPPSSPPSHPPPSPSQTDKENLSYEAMEHYISFSLKIFNCIPSKLPPTLRTHLLNLVQDAVTLEGSIRPGCVHLSVDSLLPTSAAAPSAATLAELLPTLHPFWAEADVLIQSGATSCRLTRGEARQAPAAPSTPQALSLHPICIHNPATQPITLTCTTPSANAHTPLVYCRSAGQYLTPKGIRPEVLAPPAAHNATRSVPSEVLAPPAAHNATRSVPSEVGLRFTLPPPPEAGVLVRVEAGYSQTVSGSKVMLVVDTPEIAAEVCQLQQPSLSHLIDTVLPDLGRVLELRNHIFPPPPHPARTRATSAPLPPTRPYAPREVLSVHAAARRLLRLCASLQWTHVAAALADISTLSDAAALELATPEVTVDACAAPRSTAGDSGLGIWGPGGECDGLEGAGLDEAGSRWRSNACAAVSEAGVEAMEAAQQVVHMVGGIGAAGAANVLQALCNFQQQQQHQQQQQQGAQRVCRVEFCAGGWCPPLRQVV